MAVSLLAAVAYIAFLFGPLHFFSKHYMRKKQYKPVSQSWFPKHHARDLYISLLSHEPQPPTHVLAAALMRRAMTDVQRVVSVRESKAALGVLLGKGLIGDDFWNQFLEAEKELEAELTEVVGEANTFKQNWGQAIFAQANDMVQHQKYQKVVDDIDKERELAHARFPSAKSKAPTPASEPVQASPVTPAKPAPAASTSTLQPPAPTPMARKASQTSQPASRPHTPGLATSEDEELPAAVALPDDVSVAPPAAEGSAANKTPNKKKNKGKKKK